MTGESSSQTLLPLFSEFYEKIRHGSFTRFGGGSIGRFAENNVSFNIGDDREKVLRNRQRIKEKLDLDCIVSAHQVHGPKVCHITEPVPADVEIEGYDALITDQCGVGLLIQHADCQAVMIYDPVHSVVAAIHNGWRGSVVNIISRTITKMRQRYGSVPTDFIVGVAPSLGPCCSEFIHYKTELPKSFLPFQVRENYFDFWQITTQQLVQCGVTDDAITIAGICTSCSSAHFSYRRACRETDGITGRNGTLIALL